MKGRRISLQRPPPWSPVRAGVFHVPPLDQAGSTHGLTSLAHTAGPHHGDLDEPAARSPQAAVSGGAARGGVLCDGTHVLDEAHRRCRWAARSGEESKDRRWLALRGEEGVGSDAARAKTGKNGRERRDKGLSGSGPRLGLQPPGRGFSLAQAPPPPQQPIPGRPERGPAHSLHSEAAPLPEPRASAGPREIGGKQGSEREGDNVRDPACSRCASTRPHQWMRGLRSSWGICPCLLGLRSTWGICPCLRRGPVMSAESQIRGGFRGTHPCLPTSPPDLRRSGILRIGSQDP